MCKHNWELVLPKSEAVAEEKKMDYIVEVMLSVVKDIYYCPLCKRVAHVIKSRRSGTRLHKTNWALDKANEIRKKYDLPILEGTEIFNH